MQTLPVFYFTSTIITLDDDALMHRALSNLLKSNYQVCGFNDTNECMNFFANYTSPLANMNFLRECIEHEYHDTTNHSLVDLNIPSFAKLKNHPNLTEEVSVLIVDYNMPKINGIEFCRRMPSSNIKKILLTGEASEAEAITAFNDNIINRFIRKDSPSLARDIQSAINSLTHEYFKQLSASLVSHIEADHRLPLTDPAFAEFFSQWCLTHSIKEYTLIDKNGSFMVINDKGQHSYFVIHTDRSLNSFIDLNDDIQEVESFITGVEKRKLIPFFGVGRECWDFQPHDWNGRFYAPNTFRGRENYYWVNTI